MAAGSKKRSSAGGKTPPVEHNHGSGDGDIDPASGCCTASISDQWNEKNNRSCARESKTSQFAARKGNKSASSIMTHAAKNFGINQRNSLQSKASQKLLCRMGKKKRRIQGLPKHAPYKSLSFTPLSKTFFIGGPELPTPANHDIVFPRLPNKADLYHVSKLKIIDSLEGALMPGVFTLLPREKVRRIVSQKKTFRAFQTLESKGSCNKKNGERITIFESLSSKYVTLGAYGPRIRRGIEYSTHGLEGNESAWNEMSRFYGRVVEVATSYLPSEYVYGISRSREFVGAKPSPLKNNSSRDLWPAISSGRNVFLNSHKDDNFCYSLTTVLEDVGFEDNAPISNYFCFPQQGVSVALRPGDLLLFNPHVYHSVSSRSTKNDVYCISFYMKIAYIGGNDNKQQLSENIKEWAKK